jgi:hypothetical protein
MPIIEEVAQAMQAVLTERADELAKETGFIKRQRQMTGSGFVQALVFGFLSDSAATVEALAQSARNVKVSITRQGLDQRFTAEAAAFLEQVLNESIKQVIAANPVKTKLLNQFTGVYVVDSTTITLPDELEPIWQGCEGSAVKITICWDLLTGQLIRVYLHHAYEHDQQAPLPDLPAGAIWLKDLGYFKLDDLEAAKNNQNWWCSRYKLGTFLYDEQQQQLDLVNFVASVEGDTFDIPVQLGKTHQIPCRLIGVRVPPEQLEQRQKRLREWESRKQKQASAEKWTLLAWSLYITNTTTTQLSVTAVMVMIRVRWQIELLFKLWKDAVDIDDWNTQQPWRILCEVYAKLIACIVQHWLMLCGDLHALDRSMTQSVPVIRNWAWPLAYALTDLEDLSRFLTHIANILRQSAFIATSSNSPPTFQRLREA